MLHQRHCLTPSAHPCTQPARLVGYQSSVFHTGQFLCTAKHNELRLWAMVAMSDRPRPLDCLSRQELMQKNRGTRSSRPEVEARPALSDTAKGQFTAGDVLGCSSKEAFDRQHCLLFGHSPAHQLSLTGSLCFVCSKLHLQPQSVVPLLQILHEGPHSVSQQLWQSIYLCCADRASYCRTYFTETLTGRMLNLHCKRLHDCDFIKQ